MSGSRVPGGGRAGLLTADARASPPGRWLPLPRGTHPAHAAAALDPLPGRPRLPMARPRRPHAHRHRPPRLRAAIAAAIKPAGYQTADLRRLVLTHFHPDHIGAAADIAGWGEVEVMAHHADAPFIRAQAAGPPPDLADWERPLYDQVTQPATSVATSEPDRRRRPGSTASSATATNSPSATAPWQSPSPATRQAASRSTFHGTRCYSPATRPRGPRTEPSSAACSTSTAPRPPPRSGGWRGLTSRRLLRSRRPAHPRRLRRAAGGGRSPYGRPRIRCRSWRG